MARGRRRGLRLRLRLPGSDSGLPSVDAGGGNDSGTPATDAGGGGNDSGTPATDAGGGNDSGTPATDAGPAVVGNIVQVAAGNPSFSLLVRAVTRAGLAATLSGPGPFTVFAPNDAAFAASGIDAAAIDAMPVPELTRVLTYHVLAGEVPASAVTAGPVDTVANLTAFVGTTGGVTLNGGNAVAGGANVVTADVDASNGVIHVIDRVILPPDIPALARYGGLTTLVQALNNASLVTALQAAGPFTVFAPTNAAFAALPSVPTGDALATVLKYHVVAASVPSSEVPAQASSIANNAYGDPLTLLFDTSSGVRINGGPRVVTPNLRATNGIVHVVDAVITPMNVVQAATAAGLTGLLSAVGRAAELPSGGGTVAAALAAQQPYTVFAPTNEAFTAAATTVAGLSPAQLRDVLLYHVLSPTTFTSPVLAADLPTAVTELATLNGATATLDPTRTPKTIEGANIVRTDIVVTNGVVHLIAGVIVPPT
ncbi:MAG: fasciclin domain-containing protein [Polyangiales bacterium]